MQSPHIKYLRECLSLAEKSPPRPTNFRVGAILVSRKEGDYKTEDDRIVSTGYTMELAGNTHAEQCCLSNYAAVHSVPEDRVWERIIRTRQGDRKGIQKVYFGVKEPGTFVGGSEGCKMLTAAGIDWQVVNGLERDILEVAVAGHDNREEEVKAALDTVETNLDDISDDERRRQQEAQRNPKKRMVEANLLG
ncbi:hypothetical protein APSETT444_000230 [Aspergillus pseudonomiae]